MSYEEVDQSALIHLGANVASLTLSGESWRLLSSVFLHSSVSHLLMNMFALLVVGGVVERILGKWRLLIIWLFSGVFGGLISACYALRESEQIVISVGASGAIMGIQDINHRVTLWLPWRIGFVRGGNHSIASGVLAGEGEVIPDTVYDMRYLLDIVSTDGYYWYMSGKICERVSDYRTAAFFEIGRLLTL
ncbi:DUF6710 family protein [Escherichia coli]|uniref:DUF6710 family protein n=1 Tax=Escherichia coli TaxID=562 RepID=UPI0028F6DCE1|nr:DUF6710 family protein [Escherichia coli]